MDNRTSAPACVRAPAAKSTAAVAGWPGPATSKRRRSVETFKEVRLENCADTTALAVAVSAADTVDAAASTLAATTPAKISMERMLLGPLYPRSVPYCDQYIERPRSKRLFTTWSAFIWPETTTAARLVA